MMKKRACLIVLTAAMVFGSSAGVYAEQAPSASDVLAEVAAIAALAEGETDGEPGTADMTEEAETEEASAPQSGVVLSENWSDFQLQIDEEVYQFPMMVSDLEAYGWISDDLEGAVLEPFSYGFFYFNRGESKLTVYILNLGKNVMPAEECIVGGMDIDSFDWKDNPSVVVLPGGLVKGEADAAAIEAAYGVPSDVYEGDLYKKFTYETDYNSSVVMNVYNESGVMETLSVRNFVAPEGFDPGTIREEVPEAVASYTKPEALSDDPTVYEIALDGQNYALPVPVSTLIADGWEMDMNDTDPEVYAKYFGWVSLRKGGLEIRTTINNPEDYATIPENCWIDELKVGGYDLQGISGALPGGISIGMPEADFLNVLEEHGVAYELEEGSVFKEYIYNAPDYGFSTSVSVYVGEDDHFAKETVVSVSCRNEIW